MEDIDTVMERLRARIGQQEFVDTYEIEKGLIQRFVTAIGDSNPLWLDPDYARQHGYEDMIAPPALILALGWDDHEQQFKQFLPFSSGVHGSTEVEFYEAARPGDVITVKSKLVDVFSRKGKVFGDMAFLTFERIYTNQNQQTVARCLQTQISFPGGSA